MKILAYHSDNTAYLKRLTSCEKIATVNGFDFYASNEDEFGQRDYYGHIQGTADICEFVATNSYQTPEQFITAIEQLPLERLQLFLTVDGKLERIRQTINGKQWTSNADALFCEICGQYDLAEAVRQNRAEYLSNQEQQARERAEKAESERIARLDAERKKQDEILRQAEQKLRNGKFIKATEFEALATKYGVNLPIKFIGWLRQHCGIIQIVRETRPLSAGVKWEYPFYARYYCHKKRQSKSINTYVNKLAEALAL